MLVGVITREQPADKIKEYLDELAFNLYRRRQGYQAIYSENHHPKTLIGSGKMDEVKTMLSRMS